MIRFSLIKLVDKIFIAGALFLIIFAWFNFYTRNIWITFIFSLMITFALMFVANYFLSKKRQGKESLKKVELETNKNFLIFKLNSKENKLKLLNEILSKNHKTELNKNRLTYSKENKKHLIVLATNHSQINNDILFDVLDEIDIVDIDVIEIVCNSVDTNLYTNIFKNKEIVFTTKKLLYLNYFLKHNLFPNGDHVNIEKPKMRFKDFINNIFIASKAKSYFFCGLILIFSSIILPYHFYYIVVGSMLLMFSIICKILPLVKN